MIRKILLGLMMSMIFGSVYAGDYDKENMDGLSKSNEFYVVTAHIDGNTSTKGDKNHSPEAIPEAGLPGGGGISIKQGENGKWRMRVFKFIPSQIMTSVDQDIIIHFVGSQGPSHRIKVDGVDKEIDLKRGEVKTITLHPTKTGVINFRSLGRQPSMSGQIIVMDK